MADVLSIKQVLDDVLTGKAWENSEEAVWTVTITDAIKNKLKELDFPRYKYVVHVVLGEHRGQGVRVASRCLWDTNTDNMCTANFSNEQLWATATVFACYIE